MKNELLIYWVYMNIVSSQAGKNYLAILKDYCRHAKVKNTVYGNYY